MFSGQSLAYNLQAYGYGGCLRVCMRVSLGPPPSVGLRTIKQLSAQTMYVIKKKSTQMIKLSLF